MRMVVEVGSRGVGEAELEAQARLGLHFVRS